MQSCSGRIFDAVWSWNYLWPIVFWTSSVSFKAPVARFKFNSSLRVGFSVNHTEQYPIFHVGEYSWMPVCCLWKYLRQQHHLNIYGLFSLAWLCLRQPTNSTKFSELLKGEPKWNIDLFSLSSVNKNSEFGINKRSHWVEYNKIDWLIYCFSDITLRICKGLVLTFCNNRFSCVFIMKSWEKDYVTTNLQLQVQNLNMPQLANFFYLACNKATQMIMFVCSLMTDNLRSCLEINCFVTGAATF